MNMQVTPSKTKTCKAAAMVDVTLQNQVRQLQIQRKFFEFK